MPEQAKRGKREIMQEMVERAACPKCGRITINVRKDGSIRCYKCGYEGKLNEGDPKKVKA